MKKSTINTQLQFKFPSKYKTFVIIKNKLTTEEYFRNQSQYFDRLSESDLEYYEQQILA